MIKMKLSRYSMISETEGGLFAMNFLNQGKAFIYENRFIKQIRNLQLNTSVPSSSVSDELKWLCVEESINEFHVALSKFYHWWDPSHLRFTIILNNFCNFQCVYCYEEHDKREFSDDLWDLFINAIQDYHKTIGLKSLVLEFYGGEPLLSWSKASLQLNRLRKFCLDQGIIIRFGMTTNGYLLKDDWIRSSLAQNEVRNFQITIDGGRNSHNKCRPLKNGEPTWDTLVNNLFKLADSTDDKLNVMVRVNYNLDTLETIDELLDIGAQLDSRFSFFFHAISKWGGINDDSLDVVDAQDDALVRHVLMERAVKKGVRINTHASFLNPFGSLCYAAKPYDFIACFDGNIRKCTFVDDKELDKHNIVGTIKDGRLDINYIKNGEWTIPQLESNKTCKECMLLPVCYGNSCPVRRLVEDCLPCPTAKHDCEKMVQLLYEQKKQFASNQKRSRAEL